jgi:hypothetical protein
MFNASNVFLDPQEPVIGCIDCQALTQEKGALESMDRTENIFICFASLFLLEDLCPDQWWHP